MVLGCLAILVLSCAAPLGGSGDGLARGGKGDAVEGPTVGWVYDDAKRNGKCSTAGVIELSKQMFVQMQHLLEFLGHGDFFQKIHATPVQTGQGTIGHSIRSLPYLWGPAAQAMKKMLAEKPNARVLAGFRTVVMQYLLTAACGTAAAPGDSWHVYGRAVDLTSPANDSEVAVKHGYSNGIPGHPSHYVYNQLPQRDGVPLGRAELNQHWLGEYKDNFHASAQVPVLAHQIFLNMNSGLCTTPDGRWGPSTGNLTNQIPAKGYKQPRYLKGDDLRALLLKPKGWCDGQGGPMQALDDDGSDDDASELAAVAEDDAPIASTADTTMFRRGYGWPAAYSGEKYPVPGQPELKTVTGPYSDPWLYLPVKGFRNPTAGRVIGEPEERYGELAVLAAEIFDEELDTERGHGFGVPYSFIKGTVPFPYGGTGRSGTTAFGDRLNQLGDAYCGAMRWNYKLPGVKKDSYYRAPLLVGRCDAAKWAVIEINEWGPGYRIPGRPAPLPGEPGPIMSLCRGAYNYLELANDSCVLVAPAYEHSAAGPITADTQVR